MKYLKVITGIGSIVTFVLAAALLIQIEWALTFDDTLDTSLNNGRLGAFTMMSVTLAIGFLAFFLAFISLVIADKRRF